MIIWSGYGDLLSDSAVKVVPCNAAGAMGAGLAKDVRDRWPEVYECYKAFYHPGMSSITDIRERARQVQPVTANDGNRFLLVCSKFHWRESANEQLIRDNLETIDNRWRQWQIPEIALPLLGTGLGYLGREHIHEIIKEMFGQSKLPVKLYLGLSFSKEA